MFHIFHFFHCCSFVWPWEEVHLILVKYERRVSGEKNGFTKILSLFLKLEQNILKKHAFCRVCGVDMRWTGPFVLGNTY